MNQQIKNLDWKTHTIGSLCEISRGGSPRPIQDFLTTSPDGYNWLRIGDVPTKGKYITKITAKIIKEGLKKTTLVKPGDFILSNSMSFGRPYIMNVDACIHDGWLALKNLNADLIERNYLYYLLLSPKLQNDFRNYSAGSGVLNLKKETVEKVLVTLPITIEQKRIVKVLETWDESIQKLGQVIALKREVKKGLMQKLLTGELRLPGFKGEWKVMTLGEVAHIKTGKKDNQNKISGGQYPFFVRSPHIERIDSYSFDGEAILVPGEGNVGKIFHYINGKFDYHQRVYKISNFEEGIVGRFVYYMLVQNFEQHVTKHSVKATVDSLRLPTFQDFEIKIPSKEEQLAVINVLDCVTNDIGLLERKLDFYKDQKKYLLNNLVTGQIRTPENL